MCARGLMRAGSKVLVAPPTSAAMGHDHALIGHRKIADQFAGRLVIDDRADRDSQDDVPAIAAGRPPTRHKLLPAERHTSIPAPTRFDPDYRFINKHLSNSTDCTVCTPGTISSSRLETHPFTI